MQFSHLHVHTQYSLLDGASDIEKLYKKAEEDNMPSIAITDHGNMFGVFRFVAEAHKNSIILPNGQRQPKVKPIIGCEFYLVDDRTLQTFTKKKRDNRYHQLLLAKNANGYKNLIKLCSLGYKEGMYSKYPRIDKELILKYHKDLIATTCCLGARVPRMILDESEEAAEKEFQWWLNIFQEDYYIELQRHDLEDQSKVNEVLIKWSKKYSVKYFASNDVHYVDREDNTVHDILLCINTGEKLSTPKKSDIIDSDLVSARNTRFAFPNDNFFFKTTDEMLKTFSDIPDAIENTNEIISKIETLNLKRDILLPNFSIPSTFNSQFEYLKFLTFNGAKEKYFEMNEQVLSRINYELEIIQKMGFSGYFLIVQDFINAARKMNVIVGPGRGSAVGSIVAYCLGITTLDPLKYNLLFERFLNPDRNSLPDIDTDIDDEGRKKVIDYIVEKYGRNQVAQIVNYGTLRSRNSIRDVARVMDLSLQETAVLSNLIPQKQTTAITLKRMLYAPLEGKDSLKDKEGLTKDEIENVKSLRKYHDNEQSLQHTVLTNAVKLEGTVRNTGIHAAGIIIAPDNLMDIIPLCSSKETDLNVTQIDGRDIEDAGVIKMDVLSIKTLTFIKNTQDLIRKTSNKEFDIEKIPLDDKKTFELFQKGNTIGLFQFESAGMQQHLKNLLPDRFEDLIAMNALYRPGPMAYIVSYIRRKHGLEPVSYELDVMEEVLQETYGITVYQEQVMLLSQKIANFTRGDSDFLRKAMGKKDRKTLDKMKQNFLSGAEKNGYKKSIVEKIWKDWEAFASYAFNKSHSTVYALIGYHTACLKAHYPNEFFTALLNNNRDSIDKITFLTNEIKANNIEILGPDINESEVGFSLNSKKQIRFGLDAIKGLGINFSLGVIKEREDNGNFKDLYDLLIRVDRRTANKKNLESLIYAGAFDCFKEFHRAQYLHFQLRQPHMTGMEVIIKELSRLKKTKEGNTQQSLFSDEQLSKNNDRLYQVKIDECPKWTLLEQLQHEKNVTGIYFSGHPLDNFSFEFKYFDINEVKNVTDFVENKEEVKKNVQGQFRIAGIVTQANHRVSKLGTKYVRFNLEDYSGSIELGLFKEGYLEFGKFVQEGSYIVVVIRAIKYFGNPDYRLVINQIFLLEKMRETLCKKLTLTLQPKDVNHKIIDKFKAVLKQPSGNTYLKVAIYDQKSNETISLINTEKPVFIDSDMADYLVKQEDILVSVN